MVQMEKEKVKINEEQSFEEEHKEGKIEVNM